MPPPEVEARLAQDLPLAYTSSLLFEVSPPSNCGVRPGGCASETTCGCADDSSAHCSAAAATEVAAVALSEDVALPLPRLAASIGEDVNSGKGLRGRAKKYGRIQVIESSNVMSVS